MKPRLVKPDRLKAVHRCEKKPDLPTNDDVGAEPMSPLPFSVLKAALPVVPLRMVVDLLAHFEQVRPELALLLLHDGSLGSGRLLRTLKRDSEGRVRRPTAEQDLDQVRISIDHDCVQVRLDAIRRLAGRHSKDLSVFQLICSHGLIDSDREVRLLAISALYSFDHFAGQVLCTLNRRDTRSCISGMFVCALEDEFMQIRRTTVKVLERFALDNSEFAQGSIDHIADMLNDEIEAVRLQAIHTIRNVLVSNRSTSEKLDMTDFVGLLSTLEDKSSTVRSAFRGVLEVIIVDSKQTLRSIVNEGLLKNLKRYPDDKEEIWSCAAKLGRNHEQMVVLLHGDMLGAHSFLTPPEPDIDDPFYLTVLIFLVNGLFATKKHWTSPFNIPFLERHVQALRVMDRNLLPETIRYLTKSNINEDALIIECEHLLARALQACHSADRQKSSERLCKCREVLETLKETPLQEMAAFYQAQAELRACVYRNEYNEEHLREMAFNLLAGFENVDGIPDLVTLARKARAGGKDLPPFVIVSPQQNVFQRRITVSEPNQDVRKVGAGLALPLDFRIRVTFNQPMELYAQVNMPTGRTQMHFIRRLCPGDEAVDNYRILVGVTRPWTSAAMVRVRFGCLLDQKYSPVFQINERSAKVNRLLRFVPLTGLVTIKMQSVDVMF